MNIFGFIKHLCDVFDEVKKVLKLTGTMWINLGDTYSTGSIVIPPESLLMIPFRFAIEMVERGWILRNVIIWHKEIDNIKKCFQILFVVAIITYNDVNI